MRVVVVVVGCDGGCDGSVLVVSRDIYVGRDICGLTGVKRTVTAEDVRGQGGRGVREQRGNQTDSGCVCVCAGGGADTTRFQSKFGKLTERKRERCSSFIDAAVLGVFAHGGWLQNDNKTEIGECGCLYVCVCRSM